MCNKADRRRRPARQLIRALVLSALFLAGATAKATEPLDRIVAVVNDGVVLQSELNERTNRIRDQLREQQTSLPDDEVLRKQVLDRLVMEKIQLQLAERSSIRVDDRLVNANLRRMAEANGLTLDEFRRAMEQDGYSFAEFREEIRTQLIISRLRSQQVENRIQVTDQEIDNELANVAAGGEREQEYLLSHILVAVPEAAGPGEIQAARTKAQSLLDRLQAGENFHELAVAESDGQKALEGGDVGWRKASQIPTLFADAVREMRPGQTSGLIRSASGFHIVKVEDIRGDEKHMVIQTHARHILIKPDALTTAEDARTRLEQLRIRIKGGDDFATLARSHSQDTVSAARGGDLAWVNPGEMVPEFEEVMDALQPGEISEPFESRFGWHLVEILERRDYDSTEEYRRNRAREAIFKRKSIEETAIWLRRLRDESYVEYRLES
jgi:peptidyl-prolyl cis-trans isomerase SurA